MRGTSWVALCLGLGLWLVGCADDEDDGCTPGTFEGCDDGRVCEVILGEDEPACVLPVELHGHVFDALDEAAIEGASVVALDANGSARSGVAFTDEEGDFALRVAVDRSGPEGTPVAEQIVLRVAAQGYEWFAKPPRTALPVDIAAAVEEELEDGRSVLVVAGPETEVALVPLPGGGDGLVTVSGHVDDGDGEFVDDDDLDVGGVLVLAEQGGAAVSTAASGGDGAFVLFNVPKAATTLRGVRAGLVVAPEQLTPDGDVDGVVLEATGGELRTVTGSVEFANAPGDATTSVILVDIATFDPDRVTGEAPAGLRAAGVKGAFAIEEVPPGRYAVLAAFENDGLVRDPDETIGGTDVVTIDVPEGDGETALPKGFKVTGALDVVSPGASGTDVVTAARPVFTWADDSSEEGYELRVYDVFGELVLEETDLERVTGDATVSYTWDAAGATPGLIYQFRVLSFHIEKDGSRSYIAATEDLRGVFRWLP